MEDPINPYTLSMHSITMLLIYAYIKQSLTFHAFWVLLPSVMVFAIQGYKLVTQVTGLRRGKYLLTGVLLSLFVMTLCKAIKDEGGSRGEFDDDKWLVKHRKCFQLLILALGCYIFCSLCQPKQSEVSSLLKQVLINIFSSLSMPLTICSGGACNSIYISTITSILSSFSVPLTLVVPFLNVLSYILQLVGLFSLYTADKWRSPALWIYICGMVSQIILPSWIGCVLMIIAVLWNAKQNKFIYGKKLFKESII